jgi:uncharacterized protein
MMMPSRVFFSDLRASRERNIFHKIQILLDKVGINSIIGPNDLVAIKLHFGEKGCTSFVSPIYLRVIVDKIKEYGGKPFLTDVNSLYVGPRSDAVLHHITAMENGFVYPVVNAPVIIAGGLRGKSAETIHIGLKHYQEVEIASEIIQADTLVSMAHFKGHELTGFGGAIKNLGMGCATRRGKLSQHSTVKPEINQNICIACGTCLRWCAFGAIHIESGRNKARINDILCAGCGECILACSEKAVTLHWNESVTYVQEKMVEHLYGLLKNKEGKAVFLNFITQVSPACDCYPCSDTPIVGNVGIVASADPIAIDQASVDLVQQAEGNRNSSLPHNFAPGEDKFRALYPETDWTIQLKYGEELGLGSRNYQLVKI